MVCRGGREWGITELSRVPSTRKVFAGMEHRYQSISQYEERFLPTWYINRYHTHHPIKALLVAVDRD